VPGLTPEGHLLGNDFYTQLDIFLATAGSRFKGDVSSTHNLVTPLSKPALCWLHVLILLESQIQREETGLKLIVLSNQRCTLKDVFALDAQVR